MSLTIYKTIFVSDLHLGTKFADADAFLDFLKYNESESLYLVGDIIDGWAIKRKINWKQSHSDVIQKLLRKSRKGTKIYYITGNHDEFLRSFLPLSLGDNIEILNEAAYSDLKGRRLHITHGDFFDAITMTKRWIAVLGDYGYDLLLHLNTPIRKVGRLFGIKKEWSLSKYAKDNIKSSLSFITDFETILANYAKQNFYDGVICGHIHKAEIKKIDGTLYLNCGDWVESCTALVETLEGEWKIIEWKI